MHHVSDTERLDLPPAVAAWGAPTRTRPAGGRGVRGTIGPSRRWRRPFWSELWRWGIVGLVCGPLTVALLGTSLLAAIYWQARLDQTRPVDAIVVLGAAQYDGRPSPVLQARLDEALQAYNTGTASLIVVCGGRQQNDRFTEAEAARQYLIDRGVPEGAILLENIGRTSEQSMAGVARLLHERHLSRVLLVSDGYHLFRLKAMAHHLGLKAYGAPAAGSPITRNSRLELDYALREAGGVLAYLWEIRSL